MPCFNMANFAFLVSAAFCCDFVAFSGSSSSFDIDDTNLSINMPSSSIGAVKSAAMFEDMNVKS